MSDEKRLAEELLKQNGLAAGTATEEEQTRLHQMLVRERARAQRMKVGTIISWSLFSACFAALALREHLTPQDSTHTPGYGFFAVLALLYIAIVCSVSWFLRSRSVSRREVLAKLVELEKGIEALKQQLTQQQNNTKASLHKDE